MTPQILIGREYEQHQLTNALESNKAEFIVVFGRRRVGKTYLIRHFFSSRKDCIFFQNTGLEKTHSAKQIENFTQEISKTFYGKVDLKIPKNWFDVLEILTKAIEKESRKKKIVLFLDEFPWMVNKTSALLQALDYYWNRFWVDMPNVKLIICGSNGGWLIKKIIKNKGGLHNRRTRELHVSPFTILETKSFLKRCKGVNYDPIQVAQLYMCVGGIPSYLDAVQKGLSAIQNVDQICFQKQGILVKEFNNLFSSLFTHSKNYEELMKLIIEKHEGISRKEIVDKTYHKGGRLTEWLENLENTNFIKCFTPHGKIEREKYYRAIDMFILFYFKWMDPKTRNKFTEELDTKYWEEISQTPRGKSWVGYAFENLCWNNMDVIKKVLKIPKTTSGGPWRYISNKDKSDDFSGAQIDLIFDRNDGIVNLCEIKYTETPFKIDKEYQKKLINKKEIYKKATKTKKQIFISMITSSGLDENGYLDIVNSSMTLDDFFPKTSELGNHVSIKEYEYE